jgi:hypothetical protein
MSHPVWFPHGSEILRAFSTLRAPATNKPTNDRIRRILLRRIAFTPRVYVPAESRVIGVDITAPASATSEVPPSFRYPVD